LEKKLEDFSQEIITNHFVKKLKIIKEVFWGIFGQAFSACFTILGIRIITEFSSVEHYGQYVLFSTFGLLITNVFSGSIFQSFLRLVPEKGKTKALKLSSFIVNILFKLILFSLFLFLIFNDLILLHIFLIFFFIFSEHYIGLFQTLLNIEKKQRQYALFQLTFSSLKPSLAILFYVFFHQDFVSIIFGYSIGNIVSSILFFPKGFIKQISISLNAKFIANEFAEFFNFSKPLVMQKICGWSLRNLDKYLIAILLGTSTTGKYAPIVGLCSMAFMMIARIVEIILRPYYFQYVSEKNKFKSRKILFYYASCLLVSSIILTLFLSIYSQTIVNVLFGSQFREFHYLLPILSISYSFLVFGYLLCNICFAHKKTWNVFYIELFATLTNLISMPIFLINFGIIGSTYALMISYIIFFISGLIFTRKLI
tara:strand:- start:2340 stop:3614 length:1275 start_codon:yes stop_codon:yes gene_type:complete